MPARTLFFFLLPTYFCFNYFGSRTFRDLVVLTLVVIRVLSPRLNRDIILLLCFTKCVRLGAFCWNVKMECTEYELGMGSGACEKGVMSWEKPGAGGAIGCARNWFSSCDYEKTPQVYICRVPCWKTKQNKTKTNKHIKYTKYLQKKYLWKRSLWYGS